MTAKAFSKSADFFIKVVIIFTTILTLFYFAQVYDSIIFTILGIATLIALIIKGVSDFIQSRK